MLGNLTKFAAYTSSIFLYERSAISIQTNNEFIGEHGSLLTFEINKS